MRVIQITPGSIPIPPNGWGAVEKIIWEYKLSLDKIGYKTDILYADDVEKKDNQIVHVHMGNLANLLHSRGIEYVFSLHDHHTEFYGKDSLCYKENYQAIKNSKLTFVHSKHLIEFFDNLPQIVYLPHGANLKDYKFIDRSNLIRKDETKLIMMANNGIGGDPLSDRKGFLIGIEAAKQLNLPITIMCPSGNKVFFDHHKPNYDKLEILYDLDYQKSIDTLNQFDIFLHPSNLEAGHPNLTITESLAMGIPVVGTSNIDMKGLVRVERSVNDFIEGIKLCINKYDSLVSDMENYRYLLSWDIIVSKMLQNYKYSFKISEKYQLTHNYKNIVPKYNKKQDKSGIEVSFKSNKVFVKTSLFSEGLHTIIKDKRTNRIIYHAEIGKQPGQWAYVNTGDFEFKDWSVKVKQGVKELYSEDLQLKNKRVLLTIDNTLPNKESIKDFINITECYLTINSNINVDNCCNDVNANPEEFYFTLNNNQLLDYFNNKEIIEDKELFTLSSGALGDTISFIPYVQKWARLNDKIVDVAISHSKIFDEVSYPNLNILDRKLVNNNNYTDLNIFEFIFDEPLQKGYSDQFNFDYEEIVPNIKKKNQTRPIKGKYVCIGVQTTSQCKYWNYPGGWEVLCKMLRKEGLTPVVIDLYSQFGIEGHWNTVPRSAVDRTGLGFDEVINYIEHSEFFIGVSSGLSWLSYGLGKKVVMISGTTLEDNEFLINNYRVINKSVCNGCFNKPSLYRFNPGDWLWCPVNKGTSKQFECSKTISPDMVFDVVKQLIPSN